jgi:hypothetical protein
LTVVIRTNATPAALRTPVLGLGVAADLAPPVRPRPDLRARLAGEVGDK